MNAEWSEMNKEFQKKIGSQAAYTEGIDILFALRSSLFEQIAQIVNAFPPEAFALMPFAGADGYHSKTLAYSIWHIFRIEDIVAHELIAGDEQVLFSGDFLRKTGSPIITTGNELEGDQIADYSRRLDIKELFAYAQAVMKSTDAILKGLSYSDMKRRYGEDDKQRLRETGCVSESDKAVWLIDYWCGKNTAGLLKMPFSRHWIMHIEAMQRIKNKLCRQARKGVDPVAYCGFSCNHCFLGEWCGGCRTNYNVCSFATCSPNGECPNAACCREMGFDGCYECPELESCQKGFYVAGNDGANAAKAQALFIREHGKKTFLKVHDKMHEKNTFQNTQEILGQDMREGLKILEEIMVTSKNRCEIKDK